MEGIILLLTLGEVKRYPFSISGDVLLTKVTHIPSRADCLPSRSPCIALHASKVSFCLLLLDLSGREHWNFSEFSGFTTEGVCRRTVNLLLQDDSISFSLSLECLRFLFEDDSSSLISNASFSLRRSIYI